MATFYTNEKFVFIWTPVPEKAPLTDKKIESGKKKKNKKERKGGLTHLSTDESAGVSL